MLLNSKKKLVPFLPPLIRTQNSVKSQIIAELRYCRAAPKMGILFVTINLCHKILTQRMGGNWAQKLPKMLSIAVFYEYTMRFTCKKDPPRAKTNLLLMLPERHAVCTDRCERICLFFLLEAAWVSCGQSGPPRSAKANHRYETDSM